MLGRLYFLCLLDSGVGANIPESQSPQLQLLSLAHALSIFQLYPLVFLLLPKLEHLLLYLFAPLRTLCPHSSLLVLLHFFSLGLVGGGDLERLGRGYHGGLCNAFLDWAGLFFGDGGRLRWCLFSVLGGVEQSNVLSVLGFLFWRHQFK